MNLIDFKNKHKGQRAFIACNGPSLNDVDGSLLKDEVVFGLNRGYLKEDLPITYLVTIVKMVSEQWGDEIIKVPCQALFTNHLKADHTVGLRFGGVGRIFQTDLTKPMYRGNTVTYVAMQLAYWMGFTKVYCVGLNHGFSYKNTKEDKDHHRAVVNVGDDPNHFDPNYFGDGSKWLPYEPKPVEKAFAMANKAYWESGKELWNASTETNLPEKIIPRIDFIEVINASKS